MGSQDVLTDAKKVVIEKKINEIIRKLWDSAEKVDTSIWSSFLSDAHGLGFIDKGLFIPNAQVVIDGFTEGFKQLERQKILDDLEFRLAVLSADSVVATALTKLAVYQKDADVFTGNFALTWIFLKADDEWKIIHFHQSVQPVEE